MICSIGFETWRAKEARTPCEEWGDVKERGIVWEATTAGAYLMAGADILLICHPRAMAMVNSTIKSLTAST